MLVIVGYSKWLAVVVVVVVAGGTLFWESPIYLHVFVSLHQLGLQFEIQVEQFPRLIIRSSFVKVC